MIDFKGLFPSLPLKKLAKQDQVIVVAFFVTEGLSAGVTPDVMAG